MRPVNLIPPESRRGDSAPTRTGPLAYIIVGVLVVALGIVTAMTLFGNQIDESNAAIADLEPRIEQAQARAASLAPYVSLQGTRDSRVATVDSLAKSRFDWERVLRELSRVVPEGIALTNVTGTVAPGVTVTNQPAIPLRASVPGPALELVGCSRGQRPIAELISLVHDIDGVSRVTAETGTRGEKTESDEPSGTCANGTDSVFQLVAAFDATPVPGAVAGVDPAAVPSAAPTTAPAIGADPGTSRAQAEISNAAQSADNAAGLTP